MNCTIGIDIGTTSTIGVLLNTKSNKVIFQCSRSVELYSQKSGWAEEEPEEYDENANYVQIVAPQKRSRRLARGYKKLGALTPMSLQAKVGSPPADASKGKPSMFRKKWRK